MLSTFLFVCSLAADSSVDITPRNFPPGPNELLLPPGVEVGQEAHVPTWEWVTVKNIDPIQNGNVDFVFGSYCGIKRGDILKVEAIKYNIVLVSYHPQEKPYGTVCPDGTYFFTDRNTFSRQEALYQLSLIQEKESKNLVQEMLDQTQGLK